MFELKLSNTQEDKRFLDVRLSLIKKLVESFSELVDKIAIRANSAGIFIQAMDQSHIILADIFLSSNTFSYFRCDRELCMVVPTDHVKSILRGIIPQEECELTLSCEDTPQKLRIEYNTPDMNHEWNVGLYSEKAVTYDLPELDFSCTAKMPVEKFKSVVKNTGSFGEYISLSSSDGKLFLKQKGDCTDTVAEIRSNATDIHIEGEDSPDVEVAIKYLNIVNKFIPENNVITLKIGRNAPLFFNVDLVGDLGYTKFFVAPRADS